MQHKNGFTIVEILITIAIIGIVAGIVVVTLLDEIESSERRKSKAHIAQIISMVEQEVALGSSTAQIVAAVNSVPSYKTWEKIVGLYPYLNDQSAFSTFNYQYACNPPAGTTGHVTGNPEGTLYTYLNLLDGPSKTPTVHPTGGSIIGGIANTAEDVHCASRRSGQKVIAIRVDDDNNWWCATLTAGTGIRRAHFLSTVATGQLRPVCSDRTTTGQGWSTNARTRSLFQARLPDYLDS